MQIQLLTSGWCLSFSSSTECVFPRREQRQVPQLLLVGCFQFLGCATTVVVAFGSSTPARSSMCQWSRGSWGAVVACGKNPYFLRVARAVCLESGPYFLEPLVSGSHLPLCVATVHGGFLTNFFQFLREKWTPITLQFTLGNLELFLRACVWQSPRASVYGGF